MIQENIAYLAGIIDGEGYIGINIGRKGKWQNTDTYKLRLIISGTSLVLMNWLVENFGGSYYGQKRYSNKHAKIYRWCLFTINAERILRMVEPYLIIKKQQAKVALAYRDLVKYTYENDKSCPGHKLMPLEIRHQVYLMLKQLNHRGSEPVETNTFDINNLLMKIESELGSNVKNRVSDNLVVSEN